MNPNFEKPFTFDRAVRLLIGVSICVFAFLLFRKLSGVILPFLLAWLFSYMIYPLVKFFQYKLKIRFRVIAIILSLISILGAITLLVWVLTPLIGLEYGNMKEMINNFINHSPSSQYIIPEEWINWIKNTLVLFDFEKIFTTENIISIVRKVSPQLWSLITGSFNVLASLFIVFIILLYIFFILLDYEMLEKEWVKFIPQSYRDFAVQLEDDLRVGMNKYFRSQALIAGIVGVLFAIGFWIIDFPLGITLGLFMGVLNLVPYLQTLGLFPMVIFAAVKAASYNENFFIVLLSALIVLAVVQLIQDMVLVPKIMGHTTGLKPAVILLSLSIWGALLGIVGMIIALPMTTLLISYYKRFVLWELPNLAIEKTIETEEYTTDVDD